MTQNGHYVDAGRRYPSDFDDGLALVITLIEGLCLRQITARILHELALSVRAAEAVGLALDHCIDGAMRLHVLVIGETPGAHIAELPSGGIGRGKSKHERDRKCGRGVNPKHGLSPRGVERATHRPVCRRTHADLWPSCLRPSAAEAWRSPAQA
jgi:hypothetical protein